MDAKSIGIWFFSGSGQGKDLAKELSHSLQNYNVDMKDITSKIQRDRMIKKVELGQLIIIFPIYGSDVPKPLTDFFESIYSNYTKVILIALWGNAHKGKAISHAKNIMEEKGFQVNAGAEIVTHHSYLAENYPINFDTNHEVIDFINRNIFMDKNISFLNHKDKLSVKILCSLPSGTASRMISKIYYNTEICNGCNLCKMICPVGAVKDDYSIDNSICLRCLACVSRCKKKARKVNISKIGKLALNSHMKQINDDVYYE